VSVMTEKDTVVDSARDYLFMLVMFAFVAGCVLFASFAATENLRSMLFSGETALIVLALVTMLLLSLVEAFCCIGVYQCVTKFDVTVKRK